MEQESPRFLLIWRLYEASPSAHSKLLVALDALDCVSPRENTGVTGPMDRPLLSSWSTRKLVDLMRDLSDVSQAEFLSKVIASSKGESHDSVGCCFLRMGYKTSGIDNQQVFDLVATVP